MQNFSFLMVLLTMFAVREVSAEDSVEQWGMFELTVNGPTNGNPFVDVDFWAIFQMDYTGSPAIKVKGFYDGDGKYRARFMPPERGAWHYMTVSKSTMLSSTNGHFVVTKAAKKNYGPVHVTNTFHFAYA